MAKASQVSEVWLKASILGSTWAASEIILGSFLHNLQVPFRGNILTAIGFTLLIAASYQWPEKGMFWRSGLICALMKTISPSAVIFGPMIGIVMESILLEVSVRLLGRNFAGFLLGSSLAMTWVLFQKIFNLILVYGLQIVSIYKGLMQFAEKQIHTRFDLVWLPILLLLLAYFVLGVLAVWLGVKIGRSLETAHPGEALSPGRHAMGAPLAHNHPFPYSITWLLADLILLSSMLLVINLAPVYLWAPATLVVVLVWIRRYKRGMRQLSKPRFWIWFVALTMVSAFVLTSIQAEKIPWSQGLLNGLQMNFRAAIVIIGFAALGTELYNPKVRGFFASTRFSQLPIALELAFESLPEVINHLPDVEYFFTQPTSVVRLLIFQASERLEKIKRRKNSPVFMITGGISEGKTYFTKQLIEQLKIRGLDPGGFYSPKILNGKDVAGYKLAQVARNQTVDFLLKSTLEVADIGRFSLQPHAMDIAHQWLMDDKQNARAPIFFDEVGRWELQGKGWSDELNAILHQGNTCMVWVVRRDFLEQVIQHFKIEGAQVFDISVTKQSTVLESIVSACATRR